MNQLKLLELRLLELDTQLKELQPPLWMAQVIKKEKLIKERNAIKVKIAIERIKNNG